MTPMATSIAARYVARLARDNRVRRKDTGRIVWISDKTKSENPGAYEEVKEEEPKKKEKPKKPYKRPEPGSLGEMKEMWKYERKKKKEKKKRLEVRPRDNPSDAYKEVRRVRREQSRQFKEPPIPSKSDVKYNPDLAGSRKRKNDAEDAVDKELKRVIDKGGEPDAEALHKSLVDLRKVHYPLGGMVAPAGKRLRRLIDMVKGVHGEGKKASDVMAVYHMTSLFMRTARLERTLPVVRKDTGTATRVSPKTLEENPKVYAPRKKKRKKFRPPRDRKKLKVQPQDNLDDAYKEVARVRKEQSRQHKGPGRPLGRDPETLDRIKKMDKAEERVNKELDRVLKDGEKPDLFELGDALTMLKRITYPLGGKISPAGRRLNKMIKMFQGVPKPREMQIHDKYASGMQLALYQMAQQLMRELFPGSFEGAEPDVRHEQVRKLVERYEENKVRG